MELFNIIRFKNNQKIEPTLNIDINNTILICLQSIIPMMSQLQSPNPNRQQPLVPTSYELKIMKKTILAEITDVTEEDLNVMSIEEIRNFYEELLAGCVEQGHGSVGEMEPNVGDPVREPVIEVANVANVEVQQEGKKNEAAEIPSETQSEAVTPTPVQIPSTPIEQSQKLTINGEEYYRPRCLNSLPYKLAKKRNALINSPLLYTTAERMEAICQVYNPVMASTIRALKSQEIDETYHILRLPDTKKVYKIDPGLEFETKKFIVYLTQEPRDKTYRVYQQLVSNSKKPKRPKSKASSSHRRRSSPEPQNNPVQQEQQGPIDQWFNQQPLLPDNPPIPSVQKPQPRSQAYTYEQPSMLESSLAQAKRRYHVSQCSQTEPPSPKPKKPRTHLTIISQTQYISQPDDLSSQQSQAQCRSRPLFPTQPTQQALSQSNIPHKKLSMAQIVQALEEPQTSPKPEIVEWIRNMKRLVGMFQQEYLGQFQAANWAVFQE